MALYISALRFSESCMEEHLILKREEIDACGTCWQRVVWAFIPLYILHFNLPLNLIENEIYQVIIILFMLEELGKFEVPNDIPLITG